VLWQCGWCAAPKAAIERAYCCLRRRLDGDSASSPEYNICCILRNEVPSSSLNWCLRSRAAPTSTATLAVPPRRRIGRELTKVHIDIPESTMAIYRSATAVERFSIFRLPYADALWEAVRIQALGGRRGHDCVWMVAVWMSNVGVVACWCASGCSVTCFSPHLHVSSSFINASGDRDACLHIHTNTLRGHYHDLYILPSCIALQDRPRNRPSHLYIRSHQS